MYSRHFLSSYYFLCSRHFLSTYYFLWFTSFFSLRIISSVSRHFSLFVLFPLLDVIFSPSYNFQRYGSLTAAKTGFSKSTKHPARQTSRVTSLAPLTSSTGASKARQERPCLLEAVPRTARAPPPRTTPPCPCGGTSAVSAVT